MKQSAHRRLTTSVNLVNAPVMAEEEGIKFTEQAVPDKDPDHPWAQYTVDVVLKALGDGNHVVKVTGD
jgi:hypothetical protein